MVLALLSGPRPALRLSLAVLAVLACLLGSQASAFASGVALDHDTSGYHYDVEANAAQVHTGGSFTSALHTVDRQGGVKPSGVTASHVCDSSHSFVAPNTPTVSFSRDRAPGIAGVFDEAVSNGAPTKLTRVDAATRDANRRAALRGQRPAPAGQSLDE